MRAQVAVLRTRTSPGRARIRAYGETAWGRLFEGY